MTTEIARNAASEEDSGNSQHFSPEQVRPFPKAGPRKQTRRGRKKGKTSILTDTPVKQQIELDFQQRQLRVSGRSYKHGAQKSNDGEVTPESDDSSSSEDTSDVVSDSSEGEPSLKPEDLKTGDFVVVKYVSKGVVQHYVGRITQEADRFHMLEVRFLVRQPSKKQQDVFSFPEIDDTDDIDIDDIVQKLPEPSAVGATKRTNGLLFFRDVDLSRYYRLQ